MGETTTSATNPAVDRLCARMSSWLADTAPNGSKRLTLTRADVQWLLAEIEGGREALGTVVQNIAGLRERMSSMQRTIDTLMSMRR